MFGSVILLSSVILRLATSSAALIARRTTTPFDGQYIDVNSRNNATEWWWIQAGAPGIDGGSPSSLHVTFYQGYPLSALREASGGANAPENYIVINGAFPNGTAFAYELVASSSSVTTSIDGGVTGTWAGAGTFTNTADLSKLTVNLDGSDVTGTITIHSDAPHHYGCNTDDDPYFNSAVSGQSLNANEEIFYTQLGWATSQPGGSASVKVVLDGTPFEFEGKGYHDANWMSQPIDQFMQNWYFINAQVGPYDLSAVWASITNSARNFTTGFLEECGTVLQNQCSVEGAKTKDISTVTPWGVEFDALSGVNVMKGFVIEYTLKNGEQYRFNLTGQSLVLDQPIYHRWVGPVVGGKVGGEQHTGITMYDWLNPSASPYNG